MTMVTRARWSGTAYSCAIKKWPLFRASLLVVERLQHVECFFLRAVFADEAFAIPTVLHVGQRAAGRAKIAENPRRRAAPRRDFLKHRERLFVDVFLELLAETCEAIGVVTLQRVGAKFAD